MVWKWSATILVAGLGILPKSFKGNTPARRRGGRPGRSRSIQNLATRSWGWIAFLLFTVTFIPSQAHAGEKEAALKAFGNLPVLEQGRYKPWDSVARNDLLMIYERQSWKSEDGTWSAIKWLTEVLFDSASANQRPVFRVMHPDLRLLLSGDEEKKFYSLLELAPRLNDVFRQAEDARKVESQLRDSFQRAVVALHDHVFLFQGLKRTLIPPDTGSLLREIEEYRSWSNEPLRAFQAHQANEPFDPLLFRAFMGGAAKYQSLTAASRGRPVPDPNGGDWLTIWDSLVQAAPSGQVPPVTAAYADLAAAYQNGNWERFRTTAEELGDFLKEARPDISQKTRLEAAFNRSELFYRTSVAYLVAFLMIMVSWVKWEKPLNRGAFWLIAACLVAHTVGLILRMYIMGRPPVTNLYSSALFVGWGSVGLGWILERFYRNGIGSATAAMVGFLTLVVAHNLASDGDTMAMLQAVLDTNFWLATHVIVITLGYSATFLAGFLGIVFILRGFFTGGLDAKTATALDRMVFGIICFGLLFSFVGTVLGGIWADQSWGRFWGWDPKENGALLIVLCNAIILHARWGKMISARGTMVAAVFGNIVTSWSWFGTNMLGIGLHSYGFMEKAFFWLMAFVFSQLMVMAIGAIPTRLWESFKDKTVNKTYAS